MPNLCARPTLTLPGARPPSSHCICPMAHTPASTQVRCNCPTGTRTHRGTFPTATPHPARASTSSSPLRYPHQLSHLGSHRTWGHPKPSSSPLRYRLTAQCAPREWGAWRAEGGAHRGAAARGGALMCAMRRGMQRGLQDRLHLRSSLFPMCSCAKLHTGMQC